LLSGIIIFQVNFAFFFNSWMTATIIKVPWLKHRKQCT
jgi:hypothetical protein